MSNVFVDKTKIDNLANAISVKSGESVPMTLTEMTQAVDGIDTSGGGITPTGNIDITSAGVTDVTNYATATVPSVNYNTATDNYFYTQNGERRWHNSGYVAVQDEGWFNDSIYVMNDSYNAIASGARVVPSESSQTIGGANYMMEGEITIGAISPSYVGSGIPWQSSSNLTVSGATVTAPEGYYPSSATKTIASGTAGTPTATKGTVSNYSVSITPSVTNTTGYITGSTKTGTAVTVSASELVSGDKSITENGNNIDVANYSTVSVNVSGGGGSSVQIGTSTVTLSARSTAILFENLLGEPTSCYISAVENITTAGTVTAVEYDGTDIFAQYYESSGAVYDGIDIIFMKDDDYIEVESEAGAEFQVGDYKLVYTYNGTSACVNTADVQVGSGATSITFTDLEDEPLMWSCVFKSNFSTSSGYQRVICVANDGTNTYGMEMDSSAKYSSAHWTATYNNGSLIITSNGTNQGGYFHQPGYYQLTYVIADASPYEKKSATYRASTSAQTDTIEPSSGYDAMSEVNISIPAVTQTNLTADNIKSGTTVTISNGQSNLWSITGTYGGGGSSKNVQVMQSTSRINSSSLTKVLGDLTVSKTGTYDIYWSGGRSNTSTSYTWGTRLYVDGSGYGTENTSWTNNCQSNHLSNVSLTANQKLSVYARGRSGSYYTFAPILVIIES